MKSSCSSKDNKSACTRVQSLVVHLKVESLHVTRVQNLVVHLRIISKVITIARKIIIIIKKQAVVNHKNHVVVKNNKRFS